MTDMVKNKDTENIDVKYRLSSTLCSWGRVQIQGIDSHVIIGDPFLDSWKGATFSSSAKYASQASFSKIIPSRQH
jgi:hypothetical protein